MNFKDFSKKELSEILDVIQATIGVKDESELIKILARVRELVCADYGVCGLGEVDKKGLSSIVMILNLNYPAEWLSVYGKEKLFLKDPIMRYNLQFRGSYLWTEAFELFKGKQYSDFMRLASDFGLKYGVADGVNGPCLDRGSIFSFSSGKEGFKPHHKKILDILTPHMHQTLVRIYEGSKKLDCAPTEREKEVLKWMREGKSNWEISKILNISERTVGFHVQNIERKFNAVNKVQAVAIAMEHGLLS
jgi:DNA-binding CsgD family transcriptional regulator